ncbi:MAG: indole-3-glycerol-phosphate synthase [Thermoplasmataceae archaeon]|jgi:indole-3-glycerol phosphate synthase
MENIVEKIYRENANRKLLNNNLRKRGPVSMIERIRKANSENRIAVISEFKRRSPSGFMNTENTDLQEYARNLQDKGSDGISVLTEPNYFGGSYEDITLISDANMPILGKDFISRKEMIRSSFFAGSDMVLLIADFLTPGLLKDLYDYSVSLGMEVLLEFHGLENMEKIRMMKKMDSIAIGYNRRDLRTMRVEDGCSFVPDGSFEVPVVLESGITAENFTHLPVGKFDALLIGSSILQNSFDLGIARNMSDA